MNSWSSRTDDVDVRGKFAGVSRSSTPRLKVIRGLALKIKAPREEDQLG
jgi:hypothetical protein